MATLSLKQRILSNIKINSNGCWIWQRRVQSNGYGQISVGSRTDGTNKNTTAHRISYITFNGEIADGLQIDHLCKVRVCVNPDHLEAVTAKENVHRSNAKFKQQIKRTHCPKGHEYSEDNMYTYKTRIGGICRNCKTCMKERTKNRYWSNRLQMETA